MGFNQANMQKMLRQAQKMQADMAKLQEELKTTEVQAEAGGGMCHGYLRSGISKT